VRIRIQSGWEMDVRKELIVAVEEDAVALPARVNWPCEGSKRGPGKSWTHAGWTAQGL